MNLIIDNLKIDQVEHIESNLVNVFCELDSGKNCYEGGIDVDIVVRGDDDRILVDAVKINCVEDESGNEVEATFNAKALENKFETLLGKVLHSKFTNQNERELVEALS